MSRRWRIDQCSGPNCGSDIIWAVTEGGKPQPFDAIPNPRGNRALERRGARYKGDEVPTAVPATNQWGLFDQSGGRTLYMPHHATCPDVGRYRR